MATSTSFQILRGNGRFSDWDGLLALIQAAYAYMEGRIDPPSSAKQLTPESLAEKAKREDFCLAVAGDRPIGCAFFETRGDSLYIGKLAVHPHWQGRGVGRALLAAAEDVARTRGLLRLELQTRVELTENHRAFAALGFLKTGETAHPGYDRTTSFTMTKVLELGPDRCSKPQ